MGARSTAMTAGNSVPELEMNFDEEYAELMSEFPRWLPTIERAVDVDSRIEELQRSVRAIAQFLGHDLSRYLPTTPEQLDHCEREFGHYRNDLLEGIKRERLRRASSNEGEQ